MADTTFTDNVTPVPAAWLNDINDAVYSGIGTGTAAPTTPAIVRTNLSLQKTYTALTSSVASIAVNLALSNNFSHLMTENTTLAAPTNVTAGQTGVIEITQDPTSARTLAYNAFWKKAGADSMTISSTLSSKNIIYYVVDSTGTFATCFLKAAVA